MSNGLAEYTLITYKFIYFVIILQGVCFFLFAYFLFVNLMK